MLAIVVTYPTVLALAAILVRAGWVHPPAVQSRLGCLDGLRGLLATSVIAHHFAIWQQVLDGRAWTRPDSDVLNNIGQTPVALFFMISGGLFYDIVSRRGLRTDWLALYVSRLFRLVPMMALATMLIVGVIILRKANVPWRGYWSDVGPVVHWLTFTGNPDILGYPDSYLINAGVAWSLQYEWIWYLSLPALAAIPFGLNNRQPFLALIAGCVLLRLFVAMPRLWTFAPFFLAGVVAVLIARRIAWRDTLRDRRAAVVGVAALAAQMLVFPGAFGLLQALVLLVFFVPVVSGNTYFGILARPASRALGELSYGIYMLHGIVLSVSIVDLGVLGKGAHAAAWAALPVIAAVVVMASFASYRLLEHPLICQGRTLTRSRSQSRVGAR